MRRRGRRGKLLALAKLADQVFKEEKFDKTKMGVGIVATGG